MGVPILNASDVPTKLPTTNNQPVVSSQLDVDGISWNVTCVSMGNPHCVTFSNEGSQVYLQFSVLWFNGTTSDQSTYIISYKLLHCNFYLHLINYPRGPWEWDTIILFGSIEGIYDDGVTIKDSWYRPMLNCVNDNLLTF